MTLPHLVPRLSLEGEFQGAFELHGQFRLLDFEREVTPRLQHNVAAFIVERQFLSCRCTVGAGIVHLHKFAVLQDFHLLGPEDRLGAGSSLANAA